jgi:large subunit ribosomal protein L18
MLRQFHANQARLRRHQRIRRHLEGTPERPRLNVFRSGQHIYAQIIDDATGNTLVAASSQDETLRAFKPQAMTPPQAQQKSKQIEEAPVVEVAAQAGPAKGKSAKSAKAPQQQQQKGGKSAPQAKTVLPAAQKGEKKTPIEALTPIVNNRKVALAREVGKLVARRAKEKGIAQVVFDRGGYTYHGRVASLAEGAREAGLQF